MQKYFEPFKDLQITTPLIETMIFQVHQRHLFHRNQTIHIIKGGIKGFRLTPLCSPPPFKLAQSDRGQKKKEKNCTTNPSCLITHIVPFFISLA